MNIFSFSKSTQIGIMVIVGVVTIGIMVYAILNLSTYPVPGQSISNSGSPNTTIKESISMSKSNQITLSPTTHPSPTRIKMLSPTPTRTKTHLPIPTRKIALSPTPIIEPAKVEPYCSMFGDSPVYVREHQPIVLWWRWDAKTAVQVQEHIDHANYQISLDGNLITPDFKSSIYLVDDGFYRVYWSANLGPLKPGTHIAKRYLSWNKKVSDGWNTFGPGGKIETETDSCEIIVR